MTGRWHTNAQGAARRAVVPDEPAQARLLERAVPHLEPARQVDEVEDPSRAKE